MAGDVQELLDRLGAHQVHLIGSDIGVMVANAVAAQWPEQVATLTMLDVPIPRTAAWDEAASDVTTAAAPGGGHWTPAENPDFLAAEVLRTPGR
jgi:pimeloyl-ACP methyl ester carboxylesterase